MAGMKKIHDLTIDWLIEQDRQIVGELYISCYHAESKPEVASPLWVFAVEENMVTNQPDKFINLLCQDTEQGRHFHHLKFPSGFLSVCRHLLAYDASTKQFKLQLSAKQGSLFRELNGVGGVDFGIFNVDQ